MNKWIKRWPCIFIFAIRYCHSTVMRFDMCFSTFFNIDFTMGWPPPSSDEVYLMYMWKYAFIETYRLMWACKDETLPINQESSAFNLRTLLIIHGECCDEFKVMETTYRQISHQWPDTCSSLITRVSAKKTAWMSVVRGSWPRWLCFRRP